MIRKTLNACILTLLVLALIGCANEAKKASELDQSGSKVPAVEVESPVELSLFIELSYELSDDEVNQYFREPLKNKYPYITLGNVVKGVDRKRDELIAAGELPDLIYTSNVYLPLWPMSLR